MVYSTRRFVLCLTLCYFALVIFSPFSIAITLLGEERANLSAFRTFVRFVLVWFCPFSLPLGAWVGLRFVIVTLPGLFSYLFCNEECVSFTSDVYKNYNLYSCQKVYDALVYFLDNIFIRFGTIVYMQTIGIPMGTNCTPLVADLFLFDMKEIP